MVRSVGTVRRNRNEGQNGLVIWNVEVVKCCGVGSYNVDAEGGEGIEGEVVTVWWVVVPQG